MFRNLTEEDDVGFDNKGLEINEQTGKAQSSRHFDETSPTRIEITRSQYDLKRLHEEMMFKQPHSKSSELLL